VLVAAYSFAGFVSGAVGDGWRASSELTARLPAARWSPSTDAPAGSGSASRRGGSWAARRDSAGSCRRTSRAYARAGNPSSGE